MEDCLFCDIGKNKPHIILESGLAFSRWDGHPVSEGHALIIPKRHVLSFFELTNDEMMDIFGLLKKTKEIIDKKHNPDAYNIGVNDGEAAGRTVHHAHIHLIPRYRGDVKDPRGGARHVIPGKGYY
jgi:diadenosine tetraphosphate (Ap4A) HIT family hydrolase